MTYFSLSLSLSSHRADHPLAVRHDGHLSRPKADLELSEPESKTRKIILLSELRNDFENNNVIQLFFQDGLNSAERGNF